MLRYATTGVAYCVSEEDELLLLLRADRPKPRPNARAHATAKLATEIAVILGLRANTFDALAGAVEEASGLIGLLCLNSTESSHIVLLIVIDTGLTIKRFMPGTFKKAIIHFFTHIMGEKLKNNRLSWQNMSLFIIIVHTCSPFTLSKYSSTWSHTYTSISKYEKTQCP